MWVATNAKCASTNAYVAICGIFIHFTQQQMWSFNFTPTDTVGPFRTKAWYIYIISEDLNTVLRTCSSELETVYISLPQPFYIGGMLVIVLRKPLHKHVIRESLATSHGTLGFRLRNPDLDRKRVNEICTRPSFDSV